MTQGETMDATPARKATRMPTSVPGTRVPPPVWDRIHYSRRGRPASTSAGARRVGSSRFAGCSHDGDRVPGDHHLFVGRHHVEGDPACRGGDEGLAPGVAVRLPVQFDAEV